VKSLTGLHSNGRLLALPTNDRFGRKLMAVANTLAYYDTASITAIKSFIMPARGVQYLGAVSQKFTIGFVNKNTIKGRIF